MQASAAVVGEHWDDRRQGHSCGTRSSNADPACDSCSPSPEMPVARMRGSKWRCGRGEPELGGAPRCRCGSGQARRARGLGRAGAHELPCARGCRRPPRWLVSTGTIAGRGTAAGIAAQTRTRHATVAVRRQRCRLHGCGARSGGVVGENQSSEVRCSAAEALGQLGEHAASAVPALTHCLAHKDANVRRGGW